MQCLATTPAHPAASQAGGFLYHCPECKGTGEVAVAFEGRVFSRDPADWSEDTCPECQGRRWIETTTRCPDLRPYSRSTRPRWPRRPDPLVQMRQWRPRPGVDGEPVYRRNRERAMQPVALPGGAA